MSYIYVTLTYFSSSFQSYSFLALVLRLFLISNPDIREREIGVSSILCNKHTRGQIKPFFDLAVVALSSWTEKEMILAANNVNMLEHRYSTWIGVVYSIFLEELTSGKRERGIWQILPNKQTRTITWFGLGFVTGSSNDEVRQALDQRGSAVIDNLNQS